VLLFTLIQIAIECGGFHAYGDIHYQQSVDIDRVFAELIGKAEAAIEIPK
jgi:hypothetical protein